VTYDPLLQATKVIKESAEAITHTTLALSNFQRYIMKFPIQTGRSVYCIGPISKSLKILTSPPPLKLQIDCLITLTQK
jgi:hypothetical protein